MDLSTFGAVMKFSAELLDRSAGLYRKFSSLAKDPSLKEAIGSLLKETEKNRSLVEQVRRENVTEMILEPVSGLSETDFPAEVQPGDPEDARELLTAVLAIETSQQDFFAAVSTKIPYPEITRVFRKISQKKEIALATLRALRIEP
jgi:hypothetical protein